MTRCDTAVPVCAPASGGLRAQPRVPTATSSWLGVLGLGGGHKPTLGPGGPSVTWGESTGVAQSTRHPGGCKDHPASPFLPSPCPQMPPPAGSDPRSRCCPGHSRWPETSVGSRGGTERDEHGAGTRSPHDPAAATRAPPTRGAPPLHPGRRETRGNGFSASPGRRGESLAWHGLSRRLCGLTTAPPSQGGRSSALPVRLGAPRGSPPASPPRCVSPADPCSPVGKEKGAGGEKPSWAGSSCPPLRPPARATGPGCAPRVPGRSPTWERGRRGRRARGVLGTFPSSAAARREQRGPELPLGSLQQRPRASGA